MSCRLKPSRMCFFSQFISASRALCNEIIIFFLQYIVLVLRILGKIWECKLNIQKTKIMASGPITLWQIDGETVKTVADFIFGAPKSLQIVIAALKLKDACSLEGKL